jgi:hypothetical protein
MKNAYFVLTIIGTIVPYVFLIEHFNAAGFGVPTLLASAFANGSAGGFAADVLISSAVFWVYLGNRKVPSRWIYMALNVAVGLSCALPLYLYVSTRANQTRTAPAAV